MCKKRYAWLELLDAHLYRFILVLRFEIGPDLVK